MAILYHEIDIIIYILFRKSYGDQGWSTVDLCTSGNDEECMRIPPRMPITYTVIKLSISSKDKKCIFRLKSSISNIGDNLSS